MLLLAEPLVTVLQLLGYVVSALAFCCYALVQDAAHAQASAHECIAADTLLVVCMPLLVCLFVVLNRIDNRVCCLSQNTRLCVSWAVLL